MKRFILLIIIFFLFLHISSAQADPFYAAHTKVELVSDAKSIKPGRPIRLAVRMTMDDGWHVYWKNPGDSGLSPTVKWNLPEGFKAGEVHWPLPHRIVAEPLTSFGYEGEVFFIFDVDVPGQLPADQNIDLKVNIDWLACQVDCIPGRAQLQLTLPVRDNEPEIDEQIFLKFSSTAKLWPITSDSWQIRAINRPKDFVFVITSLVDHRPMADIFFYPDRSDLIEHASPQVLKSVYDGVELSVPKSNIIPKEVLSTVQGILVRPDGWERTGEGQAIVVDVPLEEGDVPSANSFVGSVTLLTACVFAFLGGLILNLMPCVLPVLSLKILGLLKHSNDRRKILFHGLFFTLGVLVSFWILAAALIMLRAAGHQIGWGFQFQSPYFVVFMASLLCVLALNLFGLFEMGTVLSSSPHVPRKGYGGSFWGGVLATIIATPCTAPFMGTALGFALSQPASTAFLVFTFLGFGMAVPYLFLSAFPQFLKWVPKPGAWMATLKTFLGFVLLGSMVWLIWVLGLQNGVHSIALFLSGSLLISLGCWIIGLIQNDQTTWQKIVWMAFSFICGFGLILASAWVPVQLSGQSFSRSEEGIAWQNFSPELVENSLIQKKPVFIDFTAAWCLTCQVNDRLVFGDKNVQAAFKELGITAIKADWTNQDQAITQALEGYGKNSIPLYVFYTAGSDKPILLPELITPDLIIKTLRKAGKNG